MQAASNAKNQYDALIENSAASKASLDKLAVDNGTIKMQYDRLLEDHQEVHSMLAKV